MRRALAWLGGRPHSPAKRPEAPRHGSFGLRSAALFCLAAALLCLAARPVPAAPTAGVPQAVWQDNDRDHRRSPSQIKRQLTPQKQVARIALPPNAQDKRAAKTGSLLANGQAPLAPEGQVNVLTQDDWRLKILPAAVTRSDTVLLGEIAVPLGRMDPALWGRLSAKALWPAPPQEGKPLQVNRSRLSHALRQALGPDIAARCILPTSLAIQRGGLVFQEDDLRAYVVKSLTPQLAAMPGEADLTDFRLPDYIFLAHSQQRVQLEPGRLSPGRISLRFAVEEADGTVLRRLAGTASLTLWITVPAAAQAMNKGDALTAQSVTFLKVNAGQLRDVPWDGRGGPWQLTRGLNAGEPILQSDLASQLMVRRGDVVSLIYARGNLRIATQAQALSDGEPGATIPVRNLQTKKQVYATVRDGSTVEIH
ncbi:flagella basal body P-ring formation protein FlgA [Desulfovibrio legallii]|uniref:Flagella basal body P-ring formation protein FlgA n=1 Tax=Desulfovibrio legallii TaxID=571438 RepID=A0A1G7MZK8_9BACT|nr:flagella basal body P-ring formation protein FlgA [Desulfovibrio legallii]